MTHDAYEVIDGAKDAQFLITCDHASNAVPSWVADPGVDPGEMQRHIAYDIGASGVARHLARLLGAPAVLSRFSRLVIDPNRGEDDPTLIMQLYDGTIIPGNRGLSAEAREARLARLYRPYHQAIEAKIGAQKPIYVAVHSMTPQLAGRPRRPWQVTVLTAQDRRFAAPLLHELEAAPDIITAENEPYVGDLKGDSVYTHALSKGLLNALIEIRQDLIVDEAGQRAWAERLAPMLVRAARVL